MKILTVAEMVQVEKASDAAGHSYDAMMELAGRAVASAVLRHMEPWDSLGGMLVLVGPGNNGGDGLVAARYLRQWEPERPLAVYCWKRQPEKSGHYQAVQRLKIPIAHAEDDPGFAQLQEYLAEADVVVDGLLGTGVSRPIEGILAELLQAVHDGMARRQADDLLAAQDVDPKRAEPGGYQGAATALLPVADYDFLHLPPFVSPRLPQVVAVDCPSGLNCDSGHLDPAALRADLTVTFANPKIGHLMSDGPAACGCLQVADIGTDPSLADGISLQLATPHLARAFLPMRPADAHKGTFGRAMVVAGSVNYTGAAHLAAVAAYRSGAGLVTLAVPPSLHSILAAGLTEATWLLLPESLGVLSPEAAKELTKNLEGYAALLVGPGLTQEDEAVRFVQRLLGISGGRQRASSVGFLAEGRFAKAEAETEAEAGSRGREKPEGGPGLEGAMGFLARRAPAGAGDATLLGLPVILDADALNALARVENWHEQLSISAILTPHPGEMARLCGCSTAEVRADRIGLARRQATHWKQVVLLKGAYTVVASPDGRATVLPFANPALSTAGSGDVLSGIIVGLLSQGLDLYEAAVLGGYLHGLAGELARQAMGDAGVMAGDLLAQVPRAIQRLRAA